MEKHHPIEPRRQCTAHARSGSQCKRSPILGGTVCRMHGGAVPQVRAAAAARIAALVDPALARLARLIDLAETDSVKLAAVKDVLDRAGLRPPEHVDHPAGELFTFEFQGRGVISADRHG